MDNKTVLIVLMSLLIAFIVLLTVLGIVFIIALRKRRPVVKVVMAPPTKSEGSDGGTEVASTEGNKTAPEGAAKTNLPPVGATEPKEKAIPTPNAKGGETVAPAKNSAATAPVAKTAEPVTPPPAKEEQVAEMDAGDSKESSKSQDNIRLDRSFSADLSQLGNEAKEWYSDLKNDLLSYDKVKERTDWKSETFSIGRTVVARIIVRAKTLCLMLAVEPAGYTGTKYSVENASKMADMEDTPTLYSIKSGLRLRYAKEMIAGFMNEIPTAKNANYEVKDFYVPYAGDVSLLRRGLIKRVTGKADDANTTAAADYGKNSKVRR